MDVDEANSSVPPINPDAQDHDHTPLAQQEEHAPPVRIDPITPALLNPVSL